MQRDRRAVMSAEPCLHSGAAGSWATTSPHNLRAASGAACQAPWPTGTRGCFRTRGSTHFEVPGFNKRLTHNFISFLPKFVSARGFIYTHYTLAPCAYCLAALGATRTDLYRVRPNGEKKHTGVSPFSQLHTPRSILLHIFSSTFRKRQY